MPYAAIQHDKDPKELILQRVGDVSGYELIAPNKVMIVLYTRPSRTKSGIILTDKTLDEDKYQSKCGLVIAMGALAFQDDENIRFGGKRIDIGDWVAFRPGDAWPLQLPNKLKGEPGEDETVHCRLIDDYLIQMRVISPDHLY
jgi:co-chaperonin GroES (HSP10)